MKSEEILHTQYPLTANWGKAYIKVANKYNKTGDNHVGTILKHAHHRFGQAIVNMTRHNHKLLQNALKLKTREIELFKKQTDETNKALNNMSKFLIQKLVPIYQHRRLSLGPNELLNAGLNSLVNKRRKRMKQYFTVG